MCSVGGNFSTISPINTPITSTLLTYFPRKLPPFGPEVFPGCLLTICTNFLFHKSPRKVDIIFFPFSIFTPGPIPGLATMPFDTEQRNDGGEQEAKNGNVHVPVPPSINPHGMRIGPHGGASLRQASVSRRKRGRSSQGATSTSSPNFQDRRNARRTFRTGAAAK